MLLKEVQFKLITTTQFITNNCHFGKQSSTGEALRTGQVLKCVLKIRLILSGIGI